MNWILHRKLVLQEHLAVLKRWYDQIMNYVNDDTTTNSIICWLKHLDKTRNVSFSHPKKVKVAVFDVSWDIFLPLRSLTYKIKILWLSSSERVPICFPTYEVGVVSIEGNKEAEEVAHRHNQLKKLIEGQNLQIRGMFCFYFVRLPSAPPLPRPMPPRSSSCRRWHSCAGWSWSRSLQQMLSSNL